MYCINQDLFCFCASIHLAATPSPELVSRVRELYHRNSSDARFLIPVIHGLTKVSCSSVAAYKSVRYVCILS